ncbi:MAG: ATP-binding cassette domain-containing protein, partial [Anaerolineales bacterium]
MGDNDRALLELSHVDTFYGPIHALRDVSIRIEDGHITCLLGGNASGKSTTLKTILGMANAANGTIEYLGERIEGMTTAQLVQRGI